MRSTHGARSRAGIAALVLALGAFAGLATGTDTATPPAVREAYEDVTAAAGLGGFLHAGFLGNSTTSPKFIEAMGPGACWLDADVDGRLDLFLVNGRYHSHPEKELALEPTSRLYRNVDGAAFTDATATAGLGLRAWGQGCAASDYDNDGRSDLFVAAWGGSYLFHNEGGGVFTNATSLLASEDCSPFACWDSGGTFFDADRDGCLDLYITRFGNWTLEQGGGNSPLAAPDQANQFFLGSCGGAFLDATTSAGLVRFASSWSAVAYDVDKDGWSDLYVSNDGDENDLYINDGDGTFTRVDRGVADPRSGMGTAIGDLDGDGRPDIVTTNYINQFNGIFLQQPNGQFLDIGRDQPFTDAQPYVAWATRIADVDHDGRNDLTIVNGMTEDFSHLSATLGAWEPTHVFLQKQNGSFEQANRTLGAPLALNYAGRGAAWADYNDDGTEDLVLVEAGESPTHLFKLSRAPGNFLTVALVGTAPGVTRDAEGARVTVSAPGLPTLSHEKRAQQGFMSSNDPRIHFGLANATSVDLEVRWPDGSTQTFAGVPANAFVRIDQGAPAVAILKRLPLPTLTGPAVVERLAPATYTASIEGPSALAGAAWDFGGGEWARCDANGCRDAAGTLVGSMGATNVTLTHQFSTLGRASVAVSLTDTSGNVVARVMETSVFGHLVGELSFSRPAYSVLQMAQGIARVHFEGGPPAPGIAVRVDIAYSAWPQGEAILLPLAPAGVRTLAGYRTESFEGVTDAAGAFAFTVPLWWEGPTGATSQVRFNPVGDYRALMTAPDAAHSFPDDTASYQVRGVL